MTRNHGFNANPRRREFWRRFCGSQLPLIATAVLIASCASVGPVSPKREVVPTGPPAMYFTLKGRISVRVSDTFESAQIRWVKRPGEERLDVFTPFGSQVAELVKGAGGGATLRRDHETTTAESIEQLTSSLLGVPLDLDAIANWTQGVGLKEDESIEQRFGDGSAWLVKIERMQVRGVYRFVSRLSAVRGDTVVRLVIDEWQAE